MIRCHEVMTSGFPGQSRLVSGCSQEADCKVGMYWYCPTHAEQAKQRLTEFKKMMDNATRHTEQVRVTNKGVWCLCGEFIEEKDEKDHPFYIPIKDEKSC
jgi:hypothetical protein